MTPLLQGVRILELSTIVMGPFAGQILADLGAEVVKIEPPHGDGARHINESPLGKFGAMYVNNNRNKKTIGLDLKSDSGIDVVQRLIKQSDVFLHNMREEAIDRLGLGYEKVRSLNDEIVYCAAVGFGGEGRYRGRPAYDDVIQAASGIASLSLRTGNEPQLVPTILADKIAALYVVYGVLSALIGKERNNIKGIKVEVPMFESLVSFVLNEHLAGATFSDDARGVGYNRLFDANRRPHKTRDGWMVILPYTSAHWRKFLAEIGREDLLAEPWFNDPMERSGNVDKLYAAIAQATPARTTQAWMDTLIRLDVPGSRVNTLEDLLADEHLNDVGFFDVGDGYQKEIKRALPQPVRFFGAGQRPDRPAPILGQDTRDILESCGYGLHEIDDLIMSGAVCAGAKKAEV